MNYKWVLAEGYNSVYHLHLYADENEKFISVPYLSSKTAPTALKFLDEVHGNDLHEQL